MLKGVPRQLPRTLTQKRFSTCRASLAGHNKWSKIKDKKGANDAQKSILYTKANHEIARAVRAGGGPDPTKNFQLANAIKRAKEQGVPKENIEKALERAEGSQNRGGEHVTYEALAAGSVGVIIECLTNNVNRTIHGVREILASHDARMAPVKFMFKRQGCIRVTLAAPSSESEEAFEIFFETCLENESSDITELEELRTENEAVYQVLCEPHNLTRLEDALSSGGNPNQPFLEIKSADLVYNPIEASDVTDETKDRVQRLVQTLEENEDTCDVWTTFGPQTRSQ